jgi:hypothetical protein
VILEELHMIKLLKALPLVILALPAGGLMPARAERPSTPPQSLSCQSVGGNTVCAGPGALSCQTTNGRTICQTGPNDGRVTDPIKGDPTDSDMDDGDPE